MENEARVYVECTKDFKKKLKLYCIENDTTFKEYLLSLALRDLKKKGVLDEQYNG